MPGDYLRLYQRSIADPEGFWREAARAIEWYQAPRQILSTEHDASGAWFPDGICNSSVNCIDRHIRAGRGDQLAIIYDSAMTGTVHRITYHELYDQVARLAGVLDGFGLEKGDRVLIYMPMIPHAVFAMLACARLGLIHSVVFGGFAAAELATRIQHCKPRVIITASCGLEPGKIIAYKPLVDQAITLSEHSVEHVLLLARKQCEAVMQKGRDHDWNEAIEAASPADPVPLQATDPLYILYTSGTTGKPKGVIRDHGGHMVALAWSMRAIYGVEPGDVYWAASDVGWVVGHSYIVYAPLLHGCTTVIYEGKPVGTPDAGAFWRVIADHRVKALFTAPTAIRAIRREDPEGLCFADYDCTSLQHLFLAGERCDPDSLHWAEALLGVPVIDHWWQTETGWSIAANYPGIEMLKVKPGSSGLPAPGYEIAILDPQGKSV
ncbi:MAG: AMP-binding protein, partial [Pseudomonadota bacterium]